MNIIKEDGKIILELTTEENKIIDYFIESRGPNVLNEYFNHFMESRSGTREAEIKEDLFKRWQSGELE